MILSEANKIIEIMLEADGGCRWCCHHLIQRFIQEFPEHGMLAQEAYRRAFTGSDEEMERHGLTFDIK